MPGIFLCYAYRRERGRPAGRGPLTDEIPLGLTVALVLHAGWILLFNWLGSFVWIQRLASVHGPIQVDLQSALVLLAAQPGKEGALFEQATKSIASGPFPLFLLAYFVSLCMAAVLLGRLLRHLVRRFDWDRRFPLFRWNDWYYLLHGESPDGSIPATDYDAIRVTAVVGDYIYWGILVDWFVDSSGVLDTVVLVLPHRRKHNSTDSDPNPKPFEIRADYLVLKYAECSNLAVLGIKLPDLVH
ncbi:MAG: hypothetical protein K1X71_11505 [Pirellulales bacterium]|nr:hypothetical protein [Pirellulales bacterium]